MALFYLINRRPDDIFSFDPDPSMACLAAAIKGAGHDCEVYDYNPFSWNEEELFTAVAARKPDIVGFKIVSHLPLSACIELAKSIREASPTSVIIAGGPHVTLCGEAIFEITDVFDILAIGEADRTIVEIADYVEKKRELACVRNIIFKDAGRVVKTEIKYIEDLGELPVPDWSVFNLENYFPIIPISTQRGCIHHCSFCVSQHMWGKARKRPLQSVLDEIDTVMKRYGAVSFYFTDPTPDVGFLNGICDFIIRNNLPIKWFAYGHIADFKKLDPARLALAGCKVLLFGIESGDPRILKMIGKGFLPQDVKPVFDRFRKEGISILASFISGFPGEMQESVSMMLKLISESYPDEFVVEYCKLQPGSPIANDPDRYHITINGDLTKNYAAGNELCWEIDGMPAPLWIKSCWDRFEKMKGNFKLPVQEISLHLTRLLAPLVGMRENDFLEHWCKIWNEKPDLPAIKALIEKSWEGSRARVEHKSLDLP